MKGKIIIALILLSFIASPVQAIYVKETCLNTTHINFWYNYTLDTDGTVSIVNFNQTHECTDGCSNNRCTDPTEERVIFSGLTGVIATAFLSALLCWLGLKFESPATIDSSAVKKIFEGAIKIIFIISGIFFATNTVAMAHTIMISGSASTGSINLIETIITNTMHLNYFFIALIMLGFFISVIIYFVKSAKKPTGYRRPRGM